ncbi:methyltransferase (plasmid) [Streptomyces sp. DSM 116496]|uniref:methyltransferase n=1 Tax=Streptomyces stoeckheimensis TaxID=3344656 RepID=UPI0038B32664
MTVLQSAPTQIPPFARILQLAMSSWVAAAVSAVAELAVADALAEGPRDVEDLAKELDADPTNLYRLLRACADLELFEEREGRVFALAEVGQALRSDAPDSMRNFARWVGTPAERNTWTGLADSVRTGRSVFESVHGKPVWEYMRDNPKTAEIFDLAMTDTSSQVTTPVVKAYDYSSFRKVVDVGGGHGQLLAAVLAANPQAQGVLFDQPQVVAGAGAEFEKVGVQDRVEIAGGDFLESVPAGGDAYLVVNVLHNWEDKKAEVILSRIREAMAEDGRVLIVAVVMPADGNEGLTVKLMDLNMMAHADGVQRSEAQYEELFAKAGLKLSRILPGGGLCSIVEAVRA